MPTVENLRYPTGTDTPDVPRDIGNLATDVAARTPFAYAMGSVSVTTAGAAGAANGTAVVTFPAGRFTAAPTVVANIVSAAAGSASCTVRIVAAATTTGFTVGLSSMTAAGTYTVHWIAIQD